MLPRGGKTSRATPLRFGHQAQEPLNGHLLDWLRGGAVDLPPDVIPLGVGVDAELDRFTGFVRIGFCFRIHWLSGWRLSPPPDNPMPSSSKLLSLRGRLFTKKRGRTITASAYASVLIGLFAGIGLVIAD
jgi:hypothetical protein